MPARPYSQHLAYLDTLLVSDAEKRALVAEYHAAANPVIDETVRVAKADLAKTTRDAYEATGELSGLTDEATQLQIGLKKRQVTAQEGMKELQRLQREHEAAEQLLESLVHAEERATYVSDFPIEYTDMLLSKYGLPLPDWSV